MNSRRMYYVMVAVTCCLGLLVLGAVVLGSKLLQQKSDTLVGLKLDNRVLEEQDTAIVQANKDIEKYKDLLAVAKSIVPQDKDQAKTIREIVDLAAQSGVSLASFTFASSTLGGVGANSSSTSNTSTPSTSKVPSQAVPVTGLTGVYGVPITVTNSKSCSYTQFISFLSRLEQKRRTAQVTQIKVDPDNRNPGMVTFELTINIFVKPS